MNQMRIPESERPALLAYLKKSYRYEDGGIVNRRTGRRRKGGKTSGGYLGFNFRFKGKFFHSFVHRVVWALCYDQVPTQTIDHINGDQLDNRIENLREVSMSENRLNMLLTWKPNKITGVTGVVAVKRSFLTMIRGRCEYFHNPYEAFFWGVQCGKRYES